MRARSLLFALTALLAWLLWASPAGAQDIDRSTPRRSLAGFLEASRGGDFEQAAKYLDLRHLKPAQREHDGPKLARTLSWVVEHRVPVDAAALPDIPDGGNPPAGLVPFGSITLGEELVPLTLSRVSGGEGQPRWLVSRATVSLVPALGEQYGPSALDERLPGFLRSPVVGGHEPWQWLGVVLAVPVAYGIGRLAAWVAVALLRLAARRTLPDKAQRDDLTNRVRRPLRMVVAVPVWHGLVELLSLTHSAADLANRVERSLLFIALGWLVVRGMAAASLWFRASLGAERDTPAARSLRTRIALLRRVASIIVALVVVSVVLLQFDLVRDFGVSLLASAGVAGVVLGLAAQKTLSAIIAGIQLSFAQQIRIGDIVVLDKEFGTVEEIHLTHVVVKVWDERRLVVPIQRFLEQTFENWTKVDDALLGTVFLDADYRVPVAAVRDAVASFCKAHPLWDGRVCKLVVTGAEGEAVTLRALVSARNAGELWDLRCALREHLVGVLRDLEGGRYLRRRREERVAA
jgi:hypothetical protein